MSFAVHKLEKFSSNPGKVKFERLVHLLIYIRGNKTLGFNYYADMKDAPLYDLLIQANINNENQLMAFSDFSWKYFQTLVEVQKHISSFIKVGKLTTARMLQDQLLNKFHKASTIQHELQEFIYHILGC